MSSGPIELPALCSLSEMTPARLRWLCSLGSAAEVWARVAAGRLPEPPPRLRCESGRVEAWGAEATRIEPREVAAAQAAAGVAWFASGAPELPEELWAAPDAPVVVFVLGDPAAVAQARVGIVGTRRCTRYGHDVAVELGRSLADAGVAVVSGLALGIDAAAHHGALAAGAAAPVAVVANGLDQPYPRRNSALWWSVADRGAVISEWPVGVGPSPWRFPVRNRIIAMLSPVLVVVESHASGGSLVTAIEAADRGRAVMAVPGSIRSAASAGTNRLLADGVAPCLGVEDALMALGLQDLAVPSPATAGGSEVDPADQAVLDAVGWEPVTLESVCLATGRAAPEVAASLARLRRFGLIEMRGGWIERRAERG